MKKTFGKMTVRAAGVTFENRQGKLWNVLKLTKQGCEPITMLRREPNNEKDPNAIAILVKAGNTTAKIGYVPANKAVWLAKKMDNGMIVRANNGKVLLPSGCKTLGYEFNIAHELNVTNEPVYEPAN